MGKAIRRFLFVYVCVEKPIKPQQPLRSNLLLVVDLIVHHVFGSGRKLLVALDDLVDRV